MAGHPHGPTRPGDRAIVLLFRRRPTLGPGEAWTLLQVGAGVLLDVRSRAAFAQVRAPGARNVPLDELDTLPEHVDRDDDLLLVDANGQLLRAVAKRIRAMGYRVNEVSGGMTAWRLGNLPLEGSQHGTD